MLPKNQDKFRKSDISMFVGKKMGWLDPNISTLLGMISCIVAGCFFIAQEVFIAGIFVLLGGFFDILDGAIARANDKSTDFGKFLDSETDRFSDIAIFLGLAYSGLLYVQIFPTIPGWLWGTLAIVGSLMVSYTRAIAENVGVSEIKGGIADRFLRVVIIIFTALLLPNMINYAVLIIIVLCFITIGQRIMMVYRKLKPKSK